MDRSQGRVAGAGHRGGLLRRRRPVGADRRRRLALELLEGRALLSVTNLAFTALAPVEGLPFMVYDGTPDSVLATFTDAAGLGPGDLSATLLWGDGGIDYDVIRGGGLLILEDPDILTQYDVYDATGHVYKEDGTPGDIAPSVTDTSSTPPSTSSVSQPITVRDAPLTGVGVGTIDATEGQPFSGTLATFTDADPYGALGDYAATINWGDGQTSAGKITQPGGAGSPFVVSGVHTYALNGTDQVVVTVVEDGGTPPAGSTVAIPGATVIVSLDPFGSLPAGVGPLVSTAAQPGATEGTPFPGTVGTFAYALAATPSEFTATIDRGGGGTSAGIIARDPADGLFTVVGSHTYSRAGSYAATVLIDGPGASAKPVVNTIRVSAPAAGGGSGQGQSSSTNPGDNGGSGQGPPNPPPLQLWGRTIDAGRPDAFRGVVAFFTSDLPSRPPSRFVATIWWGDGRRSRGTIVRPATPHGPYLVRGGHFYARPSTFTIRISVAAVGDADRAVADSGLRLRCWTSRTTHPPRRPRTVPTTAGSGPSTGRRIAVRPVIRRVAAAGTANSQR